MLIYLFTNSLVQLLTHWLNWNQISGGFRTVRNSKNSRNIQSVAENDIKYSTSSEVSPIFLAPANPKIQI